MPGLDGIRALAVVCVIAYHLGMPGAQGGMLGVGVFFTLSGYLITDLLLAHWRREASLGLGQFWLRRARRLLPPLFLMLIVVSVWVALFDVSQLAAVRRQVLAASVYVSNWSTIVQHGSYFSRFAAPLPLDHLWSLAIEEQFYLVWPFVLMLGIWVTRKRWALALFVLGLAAFSAVLMSHTYHPGYDPTRAYEGTDTRAFGLLIGATLAIVWPSRLPRLASRTAVRNALDVAGVVGLVAIGLLVWRTNAFSAFLYPWGFMALSLATAAVVAAAVNPSSRLGAALGWRPMRWVGVRSYGIYLWQWPIIVLASPAQGSIGWARGALMVVGTLAIASVSWRLVEEPIRQGALGRHWKQLRVGDVQRTASRPVVVASSTALAVLCVPALSLAGLLPAASARDGSLGVSRSELKHAPLTVGRDPSNAHVGAANPAIPPATKTSCRAAVYIGDSTSEGEISTDYIPNPRQRLGAQLADIGVKRFVSQISGARSIVEVYRGLPDAATVARHEVTDGFRGCWILALGTNEAADVAVGSNVELGPRIARMMSIIGDQPVLWVDAVTLVQSGPYAESGMRHWNADLVARCSRYPNMRVFDWAHYAKARWFIPDGIHYYSPGYVARAHLIARGVLHAFPAGEPPSASCVVR
jgi:peptidoglycan/LPS O-acetylase OafA/YrhL